MRVFKKHFTIKKLRKEIFPVYLDVIRLTHFGVITKMPCIIQEGFEI